MKVDHGLWGALGTIPEQAKRIEADGFDAAVSTEVSANPFLPLTLAAEHTERIDLMTSIAVAFARTPMTVAQIGHDLNAFSKGRFVLGLGSQIRPHIEKRFSMPWSKPAARMREFIRALHAIWDCWYDGAKLDFRGEFYTHTLMTPNFVPQDRSHGRPRVFLAAVGPAMTEVAGEVADGIIAHGFTTDRYMREVTLPALERGLEKAGRKRSDIEVVCPVFSVVGAKDEEIEARLATTKRQISFYGSTPAYRPVLDQHGWGDLQTDLNALSKAGKWAEMGELITQDVVDAFAVVTKPDDYAGEVLRRYGDMVDRLVWNDATWSREQRVEQVARLRKGR